MPADDVIQTHVEREVDALAREFAGVFSRETIARLMDDSLEQLRGTRVPEFLPVMAWRFTRERLMARGRIEGTIADETPELLFVCVQNAGRSQMAAVMCLALGRERVRVRSAGSAPASEIHAVVFDVMREAGYDLAQEFPKPLTDEAVRAADVVITMGCGDACPVYPGKRYLDWDLDDPSGQSIEVVRRIRDDIEVRVAELLAEIGEPGAGHAMTEVRPGIAAD